MVEAAPGFWQYLAQFSPYFAEFIGCLMQALAWNCTELGKKSWKEMIEKEGYGVDVKSGIDGWKPLVCGLTLVVSTYSFGVVSGAHLNPAVSIAVGLSNYGQWRKLMRYMLCQLLGSASGVVLSCLIYQTTSATAIGPRGDFKWGHCVVVEFFYTGMLCFVFLHVTLSRHNNPVKSGNQFFAMAVGCVMAAASWAGEDISGAIYNPAVSLAVDFQNLKNGGYGFTYTFAQILGCFFAAVLYRVVRPSEEESYSAYLDYWSDSEKNKQISTAKLFAEGLGSFFLVFTFGMTTLSKTYVSERPIAAGFALMSMHYALADVSGGFFNPAVTLSVMLNGRNIISIKQGGAYMVVQVIFGTMAAFIYTAIHAPKSFPAIPMKEVDKFNAYRIGAVEGIFSFVICYAALSNITVVGIKSKLEVNYYSGLAYGFASAAGGFAILKIANSLANPALTLGVALAHTIQGGTFYNSLWASFVQFAGAVIASSVFRITHAIDFRRRKERMGCLARNEAAPLVDKAAFGFASEGVRVARAAAQSSQSLEAGARSVTRAAAEQVGSCAKAG